MDNKKLKRLMTDVVQGKISEKDAQDIIKAEKTAQSKPNKEIKGKNTHKRKKTNKAGGKLK